ncbi:hypothetical protein ASO20_02110 [Mycoplasma sp. (ex Biomphalaria glabrata)]|uniref:response regulator n=1 Tax=Mycoplasma sp. (ex Biomphalaria glabrata) TaxID=1749074 RepID=UPI00073A61AF|nr:response regulator [Mycoplasma sp. (ex Biomphalaria glabrata)]ALV23436.1 hypothetical protein ASO20_02110 [Mycoplasma sp. (ex Biomphalaria glabrata)]
MKILVIDDNKQINDYWSLELFRMNFSVESSFSIEQTYTLLEKNSFDLILLDLHLGTNVCDGFEIIDYINRKKFSTSVIVISGNNIEDFDESQLLKIKNSFAFVKKPCLKNELTLVIEKWLTYVKNKNIISYGKYELDSNKKIIYKNKKF